MVLPQAKLYTQGRCVMLHGPHPAFHDAFTPPREPWLFLLSHLVNTGEKCVYHVSLLVAIGAKLNENLYQEAPSKENGWSP